MPAASRPRSSSRPAGPTNGFPLRSSRSPGCSPTSIRRARLRPSPNTVWVAGSHSGHPRQPAAASRSAFSPPPAGMKGRASFGSDIITKANTHRRGTHMGLMDRITGRAKKAAGDLSGDQGLRRQGAREEAKADAEQNLQRAHDEVEEQAVRVREAEEEADRKR